MSEQTLGKRFISRLVSVQSTQAGARFVLSAAERGRAAVAARFAHETEMMRQARHPNLLREVNPGNGENSRSAEPLSTDWPGNAEWLSALTLRSRLRLFAEIASVLGGLHRSGIVYGVLHPDRLGLRLNGEAVLLDLGMTWAEERTRGGGDALDYCAPECFSSRVPDARADIFSLGLLLRFFLTGEAPASRRRPGQSPLVAPLPENLSDLQPMLALMLVEQPAQRPRNITMLLDQLNALVMRSPRLAAQLEADRDIGELAFERLLTPLSALSQRPALASMAAGGYVESLGVSRWDSAGGAGRLSTLLLGLGLPVVCGLALLVWLQTRPEQEQGLIERLVHRADSQLSEDKLLFPAEDNALDTLRTLRSADPDNSRVAAMSERIEQGAAGVVERALQSGLLDDADLALNRAIRAFPENQQLAALSGRLAQARRQQEEHERLNRLFALIDEQLATGAIVEPGSDGAYALWRQAQELSADDPGVVARRQRMETALADQARGALEQNRLEQAKDRIDRLRELAPTAASLAQLDTDYRQRLGAEAHKQQLAKLLANAAAAEASGLYQLSGLRRALENYLQIVRLAPEDSQAKERVARLGKIALQRTEIALKLQDWEEARQYLALGQRTLPQSSELASLGARVERGAREQYAEARELLDRADLALRRGNYFSPEGRSAWALYQQAQAQAAVRSEVQNGLKRLRAAVLKEVDAFIAQRRYDDASALVEKARRYIAQDPELGRRKLTLSSILEQNSAAAVAVADGFLALNAIPWAHIDSVKRASNGQAVALEKDATTPLRLTLPAGDYLVVFRNPGDGQLRSVRARVQSGQNTNLSVNLRSD